MATAFVGRALELARLKALAGATLVTLWGPGGVGKTRLAREHAEVERLRGRTVAWADLAAARTRGDALATFASALGVTAISLEEEGSEEDVDGLARAAAAQNALLIADNLEQLDQDGRAAVVRLATGLRRPERGASPAQGSCVLVTSRELLGAPGEVTVPVSPLGEEEAVALFDALAGSASGRDPSVTRAIVRRLDAIPLAIELAAARVPLLGAPELLARLDRKLDVLGTAMSDRPARHATLRAAIAWSWELLDQGERDALMACATFEAPFDASLAEAVIGGDEAPALDRLERLRGRALVHASTDDRGRTRLRLLESVRDFARDADASPEAVAQPLRAGRWTRHDAAVVACAEPLAEAARCGRDTLPELESLRADLLAASRRAGPLAPRATLALASLIAVSGPASSAVESVESALASSEAVAAGGGAGRKGDGEGAVLLVRLLLAKGEALRALGKLVEARAALERAMDLASQATAPAARGDGERQDPGPAWRVVGADASRVLGSVLRSLGEVEEALAHKARALVAYQAVGDRAREGICLGEIGAVHQSQGRLALAQRCHAEAIAIHVANGSRRAEGVERSYLAVATHRAGELARSISLHQEALAIHREVGHRRLEGAELLHLGFVHHELGALAASREALSSARSVLAAAGARGLEAIALVFAARLEVEAGDPTAALLFLAASSQVAPGRWPRVVATRHLVEGHLAMATGSFASAQRSYEAALATSRDLEVGFEALTPAYLALATARAGGARSPEASGQTAKLLKAARSRVSGLENPHLRVAFDVLVAGVAGTELPEVPALSSAVSSEVRRALALTGRTQALAIEDEGRRVVLPDGRSIDLSRRKNVRHILLALARARRDAPGVVVSAEQLLEAGWPGERMRPQAAIKRLHTAIWTLRSLGLEPFILTEGEAYLLDPRTATVLNER